jgi:zinc D-Ala-D-Ala dipeptidase
MEGKISQTYELFLTMIRQIALYLFCCFTAGACSDHSIITDEKDAVDTIAIQHVEARAFKDSPGTLDRYLDSLGLVNILTLDSTIKTDIRYSTVNNFVGKDLYGDFNSCYLQKDVALKLMEAHALLRAKFPYYRFLVFDGARPVSVQKMMWDSVNLSPDERQKYLSNPGNYSLHNFGAAVDLTITDEDGRELDMGTPYDYFGTEAHPRSEQSLFQDGKLTATQIMNRELLRTVMREAGFSGIETEWWHFNACSRIRAAEMYPLVK